MTASDILDLKARTIAAGMPAHSLYLGPVKTLEVQEFINDMMKLDGFELRGGEILCGLTIILTQEPGMSIGA